MKGYVISNIPAEKMMFNQDIIECLFATRPLYSWTVIFTIRLPVYT